LAISTANNLLKGVLIEQLRKEQVNNNPKECIKHPGEKK
jgi:hypothetical protein